MVQVRFRMLDTLLHPVVWSYGEQLALEPSLLARYAQAGQCVAQMLAQEIQYKDVWLA